MEEKASAASTPPSTNRRDPSAQSTSTTPQPVLSSSEPSLRFPRPQVNRRLANWISASDPDIMRLTTATEDTGLADSTYELITGTDSESQDGNYTESMGDSVDSLHRLDDVHSLDGTEYTHDGESVADDIDVLTRTSSYEGVDGNDEETQQVEGEDNDDTLVAQEYNPDASETRDEACSRSSLEYTQHSLGTPSILTPEVGKLACTPTLDFRHLGQPPPEKTGSRRTRLNNRLSHLWQAGARVKDYVKEAASAALIPLLFTAALTMLIFTMHNNYANDSIPHPVPVVFTVTATTTSTVVLTTRPSSRARSRSPSTGGMGLVPRHGTSDEWRFGPRKPFISFTPQAQTDILVHVPGYVKQAWLARDCLAIHAVRDGRRIQTSSSPVDQGILLRFPKKEAYGIVNLSLEASCRPRVQRMVKVHFGKGIMEEALEMTRDLAHDLSGLVPAVAQEAERCFEGARRSLGAVSDSVGNSVVFMSDDLLGRLDNALSGARQSLKGAKASAQSCIAGGTGEIVQNLETASQHVKEQLNRVQDVQSQLQLVLLDARISAKLWWLEATGRKEEHDDYQRKAKEFVAKKHTAAKEAGQARRHQGKVETGSRFWTRMLRQGRCQQNPGRGTHECRAES